MYKPKMECPTCGLVLYRHNFSTHYRIHTGEMPFQCNYCDKRFRTTSALKVHVRAHTGEKPYGCPRCNYACITKRNLDRHIINNHVREGVRRGPRYRRSRYRLHDPEYEEYMVDVARKRMGAKGGEEQETVQIVMEERPVHPFKTGKEQRTDGQQEMSSGDDIGVDNTEQAEENVEESVEQEAEEAEKRAEELPPRRSVRQLTTKTKRIILKQKKP